MHKKSTLVSQSDEMFQRHPLIRLNHFPRLTLDSGASYLSGNETKPSSSVFQLDFRNTFVARGGFRNQDLLGMDA